MNNVCWRGALDNVGALVRQRVGGVVATEAVARHKIGEIKIFDLEQAMSFKAGEAQSRSGLVRFSITKMAAGRYRISDQGKNAITEAGRDRLEVIRGRRVLFG